VSTSAVPVQNVSSPDKPCNFLECAQAHDRTLEVRRLAAKSKNPAAVNGAPNMSAFSVQKRSLSAFRVQIRGDGSRGQSNPISPVLLNCRPSEVGPLAIHVHPDVKRRQDASRPPYPISPSFAKPAASSFPLVNIDRVLSLPAAMNVSAKSIPRNGATCEMFVAIIPAIRCAGTARPRGLVDFRLPGPCLLSHSAPSQCSPKTITT